MPDPVRDNLGYFFLDTVKASPQRTALIDLWGGRERVFTYAALDARIDRVAALMGTLGLKPGDRFALLIGNRSEYIECFFGAMRAGVVPVPVNVKQTRPIVEHMVRDAGCVGAIVDPESIPDGIDIVDGFGLKVRVALDQAPPGWTAYEPALAAAPAQAAPALSPDGIAFQPYTAGSTGRPKGVRPTHRGMLWSIRSTQEFYPMKPDETALVAVPLFHKNAMRGAIKPLLFAGGKAVIMPRFEAKAFLEALARYRVTFAGGVPAIFARLLEHRDLIAKLDFSDLHMFAIGSAVVPPELIDALTRAFKGVRIKEGYGLTEGGAPLRPPTDGRTMPLGSCGVIAKGYEVKLVGSDGSEGVSEGELCTRSPYVTDGYHNLPDLTREKIVDGWLHTGDMFRVDSDGFYYFLGRIDDMFSCGGENIYPKEVENILFAHPAVRDACVVAVPHRLKGFVPAAAVIVNEGAEVTPDVLKAFCLEHGPAYAHPRRIVIVDELPLTGAGKHDRKAVQRDLTTLARDIA